MKSIWIIVANAKNAYFYSVYEKNMRFNLIKKLTHIKSQSKKIDLTSDRQGHYAKGYGNKLRGSYTPTNDPKLLEIKHFAKEVCEFLENGRVYNRYVGIIIVADPHFYGLIKQLSNKHVTKYIKYHLGKDYANEESKLVKSKLQNILSQELRLMFISGA